MGKQLFTSRNNINKVLTFQKSGSTNSFDPDINFSSGSRRVSWRLNNGSGTTQIAGNSLTYTGFTSDPNIRTIEMRGNSFRGLSFLNWANDNLYGNFNMSSLDNWANNSSIFLSNNPTLTGITNPNISNTFNFYNLPSCGLVGNLNMTPISGNIATFLVNNNTNLTGITHNTISRITNTYYAFSCNLTGNLNLPFTGLGGDFQVSVNPNLTGITHSPSSQNFTAYRANNCNLTGNLDLTPLSGLGGDFRVQGNSGLTSIIHTTSTRNFTVYLASNCNLTGNLDLTPLYGLGGGFQVFNNPNLTGITHSPSSQNFTTYYANNCNLTGNLDLTPLSGLGGAIQLYSNSGLTNINFTSSTQNITQLDIFNCGLIGTLDLSKLIKLGGNSSGITLSIVRLQNNPNLTNVIFPITNQFFKNFQDNEGNAAFDLFNCNLDYVDFTPLSGSTLLSGSTQGRPRISLRNNGMTSADVNHILVDFSGNATNNQIGWSNINLNIGGTNSAPDSSSGGYNGIAARNFLTGSPYNWIITHS